MSEYESNSGYFRIAIPLILGMTVGNLIASAVREDPDERVHRVQVQYEQVEDQLERAHIVDGLILDDENKTFTFISPVEGSCTGNYKESGDNREVVEVTGQLAC